MVRIIMLYSSYYELLSLTITANKNFWISETYGSKTTIQRSVTSASLQHIHSPISKEIISCKIRNALMITLNTSFLFPSPLLFSTISIRRDPEAITPSKVWKLCFWHFWRLRLLRKEMTHHLKNWFSDTHRTTTRISSWNWSHTTLTEQKKPPKQCSFITKVFSTSFNGWEIT